MGRRHPRKERLKYASAAARQGRDKIARDAEVKPETVAAWQQEFGIQSEPAAPFAPGALSAGPLIRADALVGMEDERERYELKAVINDLAERCDGAITRDDRGFGLTTVRAGHYLAMKPVDEWNSDDLDSARSVAYIHRHQSEASGMTIPDSVMRLDAASAKDALAEANSKVLLHFDGRTVTVIGAKRMGSAWQHDKATASHARTFDEDADLAECIGASLASTEGEIAVAIGMPPERVGEIEWHRAESRARAKANKFFAGRVAKGALENLRRCGFDDLVDLYQDHQRADFESGVGSHGTIHYDEESGAAWVWTWNHANGNVRSDYWYGHDHEASTRLTGGLPWVECTDVRSVRKERRVGHHIPSAVQIRPRLPGHSIEDAIAAVAIKQGLRPGSEAVAQLIDSASSDLRHEVECAHQRQIVEEATKLKETGAPVVSGFRGPDGQPDFDIEAKRSIGVGTRRLAEIATDDGRELWCVRTSGFLSEPRVHAVKVPAALDD